MTTKEYNNTEIAKRVELLRKRSGMSINKMATMAGIDTGNLSRSINGKASFSDRVIYKIASALHVSVDWLEKGIEPMFSPTVASPSEVGAGIIGSNIDASNSKGFTQTKLSLGRKKRLCLHTMRLTALGLKTSMRSWKRKACLGIPEPAGCSVSLLSSTLR